jgi:hypothetical protein
MTSDEEPPRIVPFDTGTPSAARIYDAYLGGRDHFPVDQEFAERVMREIPTARPAALANRACLGRMVRWLADQGIEQFIDLGAGLPTQGNVHEIAQQVNPQARVVYVDNDMTALAHARALLAERDDRNVIVVKGDIRAPHHILSDAQVQRLIDFSRPVAVLFIAVLHFLPAEEDPYRSVAAFREATVPGSYLAVTHATTDDNDPAQAAAAEKQYQKATAPLVLRSREQVARLFVGYDLVEPGLVRVADWHPIDEATRIKESVGGSWFYAAIGRKN